MSIFNKIRDAKTSMRQQKVQRNESLFKRKQILKRFSLPQLQQIINDKNITFYANEFIKQQPNKKEMISTIATSSKLSDNDLNNYLDTFHNQVKKSSTMKNDDLPKQNVYISSDNLSMFPRSVMQQNKGMHINIDSLLNDFSTDLLNADIDSDVFIASVKKMQQLKFEVKHTNKDAQKILNILKWFNANQDYIPMAESYVDDIQIWLDHTQ